MRLIIAEKPSMGRAIADALGATDRKDGYIAGSGIIVTWARGHIVELAMPQAYDPSLKRWTWGSLPIIPDDFRIQVASDARKEFQTISRLINHARITEVVNACDAGREGEYIFDLIYRMTDCRKPVRRFWNSSLTAEGIRESYQDLQPAETYYGLRDAARARSEADWLIGLNATRAQTLWADLKGLQRKSASAIGRVMTPTLALIYQRDEAIRTFVPKDFWTLHADFQAEAGTYRGKWFRREAGGKETDRFDEQAAAAALRERLTGLPAEVKEISHKDERKPPELLYDLTTLQRECAKRFGYTAQQTLDLAQELYEAGFITYPRTESRHITPKDEAEIPAIFECITAQDAYAPIVPYMQKKGYFPRPLSTRFVDEAKVTGGHGALLPTKDRPSQLAERQRTVYDLIVRRTLAMYWPDAVTSKTVIITAIAAETFKTTGSIPRQKGWTAVDPPHQAPPAKTKKQEDAESDESKTPLPPVNVRDACAVRALELKKGQTTPPKHYDEDTLLGAMQTAGRVLDDENLRAAMKDSGLGTPATRANIIEKLVEHYGYVERKKRQLLCTESGRQLIESIQIDLLKSPELTGKWEEKLAHMARHQYHRATFMDEVAALTREIVENIRSRAGDPTTLAAVDQGPPEPVQLDQPCPRCGGAMYLKQWQTRYYVECENHKGKGAKSTCGVIFNSNADGEPEGGICRFDGCGGPVRVTRNRSRICTLCDRWQDDSAHGTPTATPCDRCNLATYHEIVAKKTRIHYLKCPSCGFLRPKSAKLIKRGCKKPGCGGDALEQDGKRGRYRRCIREGCDYIENVGPARQRSTKAAPAGDATPKPRPGRGAKPAPASTTTAAPSAWKRTPTDEQCPECQTHTLVFLVNAATGQSFHACSDPARSCKYRRFPKQ